MLSIFLCIHWSFVHIQNNVYSDIFLNYSRYRQSFYFILALFATHSFLFPNYLNSGPYYFHIFSELFCRISNGVMSSISSHLINSLNSLLCPPKPKVRLLFFTPKQDVVFLVLRINGSPFQTLYLQHHVSICFHLSSISGMRIVMV